MGRLTTPMRVFFHSAWVGYVALSGWTQFSEYVAWKIIGPFTSILFFTFLGMSATGRDSASFYVIGNAMQLTAINGIYGVTFTVGRERRVGTLIYILGTPANRLATFMGHAFFHILDGMLTVVLGFLWGVLLLGLDLSAANLPGLALAILIAAVGTCGLGLLLGSVSLVTLDMLFVNNTIYFLLLLFSGATVPLNKFPAWMQSISAVLPLSHGIAAARLLVQGARLADVSPLLLAELSIGVIYAALGFTFFSWFESRAKRTGTLEAF